MIHCVLVWFLKPVPLSENVGTLNQQLEACRSMPQHAAASQNFLGDRWCLPPPPPPWTPPRLSRLGPIFLRAFGQSKIFSGAYGPN